METSDVGVHVTHGVIDKLEWKQADPPSWNGR
ncbi:hypothetical protein FHR32_006068 [Streptosporangium album]|uniref:Uncharacterized protein n=1 Tax=Streptosporangium album TaxID=47479 RepID=A0A7W7S0K5_9ACTN|nr:hypothetical protein [Streptosporangium album]